MNTSNKTSFWDKKPFEKNTPQMTTCDYTWGENVGPGDIVIYVPDHAFENGKPFME